jgi:spore germination cell wall hydrolase CwlJ-like protein
VASSSEHSHLPGLKAWQTQRRNRIRRRVTSAILTFSAFALVIALIPERLNPLVRWGVVAASNDPAILAVRSRAVAAAIAQRQSSEKRMPAPEFSNTQPAPLPRPTLAAAELLCLAKAAFYEARGENFEGQVAVAQVAMNRAKSSGQTICQTIAAKVGDKVSVCLFPSSCQARNTPPEASAAWLQSQWIAEEVATGRAWLRELEHAEYFHTFHVGPPWRHTAQRVRRIGQHIFYAPGSAPPADLTMARKVVLRWDEAAQSSWVTPDVELVRHEHQILSATETVTAMQPSAKPITIRARTVVTAGDRPDRPERPDRPAFNPFTNADQR